MTNKTYEHKYKLGELVWIKSKDGIRMQVRIISIMLMIGNIVYQYSGGGMFNESEVIDED